MNLIENPIFLTQKRLVHRSGVLAAVLIAALIGLSLLAGLVAYRAVPTNFPDLPSVQDAGKAFYAWTIGVEILVLIVGGFIRVARTLTEERKSGLWDSNRLTPLSASQIVLGYWLGPALREFYMALILAGTGLLIVVMGELPLTLWLGTQLLILSAALFFALLTITASLGFQRTQTGALVVFLLLMVQPFSAFLPVFMLTNFLVPTYGIVNSFVYTSNLRPGLSDQDWTGWPHFFGFSFPPILLSLGLQLGIGILLWRSAIRKTANPFQPLFLRRESGAIFTILLLAQHGLIWGLWHGGFPLSGDGHTADNDGKNALLPIIHCGTIFLAIIILAGASPQPETVRVTALRHDLNSFGALFSLSSVSLALILGGLAAALLLLQFAWSFTASWETYLIAAGNLLAVLLIFTLLLEYCRLRHRRRAVGFIALWLFVLCFLPLILAGVFANIGFAKLSLLAPGVTALSSAKDENLNYLAGIVLAHFGVALLLWILWRREWRQLLTKVSSSQN